VLDWMVALLGLPARFSSSGAGGGVIQDSASSATLCAVLAARERTLAGEANRIGLKRAGAELTAYASTEAHSSIEKALRVAGIGSTQLRRIAVDGVRAIDPAALAASMQADRAAGRVPFFVSATLGSTASGAFDALSAIADSCREHGAWLHADAAMFGTAAACPEYRFIHDGLSRVDSYCVNPHKWMLTGFDCDCFWVADRAALIGALGIMPSYLDNAATASGRVIDYRDWQIPLGRRFRSLKLWAVLRHHGVEGIQALVRHHVALTQRLAGWIVSDARFELAAPHPLNLVCFRHRGGDEQNRHILDTINAAGAHFMSGCQLDGRLTLRLCVGQARTDGAHVEAVWRDIAACADDTIARG
jgi:aromatic-L-amino-acid decarboxylase